MGEQARELLENANELLDRFLKEKCIRAKGVIALFAANTIGDDDVEIYTMTSQLRSALIEMLNHHEATMKEAVVELEAQTLEAWQAFKDALKK